MKHLQEIVRVAPSGRASATAGCARTAFSGGSSGVERAAQPAPMTSAPNKITAADALIFTSVMVVTISSATATAVAETVQSAE